MTSATADQAGGQAALYESGWCLRTTRRMPSWRHTNEGGFNPRRYDVLQIDEAVAKAFVLLHHYSRSYPAGRLAYGLFEGHHLVGVAVLGEPMHPRVITKAMPTLTNQDGAELSRVVLLDEVLPPRTGRPSTSAASADLRPDQPMLPPLSVALKLADIESTRSGSPAGGARPR